MWNNIIAKLCLIYYTFRFCAGLKICLLRNKAEKARQDSSSDNQNHSESEEQSLRLSKLRHQQRLGGNPPSPALSLPPKLDPPIHQVNNAGPPKPPRYAFSDQDRRLGGDGGAASDGELDGRRPRTNMQPGAQLYVKQEKEKGKQQGEAEPTRKQMRRRESHSRRHTLQNGIDYGLVKCYNTYPII